MPDRDFDLIIAGGGCAGLSLALALIRRDYQGRTLIVEGRQAYSDDRSWCFWPHQAVAEDLMALVVHSWNRWEISVKNAGRAPITHHSEKMPYCYLRSLDFYNDALDKIKQVPSIKLLTGQKITALDSASIRTEKTTYSAPVVIDTRAPAFDQFQEPLLYQSFAGMEVETDKSSFMPDAAFLMGGLEVLDLPDKDGRTGPATVFLYRLPITDKRALIEYTSFAPVPVSPDALMELTRTAIPPDAKTLREEQAILPMGFINHKRNGVIRLGTAGGALRPATGYGFIRIQKQASHIANRICDNKALATEDCRLGNVFQDMMDRIFLRTLKADITRGPMIFNAMAGGTAPETFARFLSDQARPSDYAAVIKAMPKMPFIKGLFGR